MSKENKAFAVLIIQGLTLVGIACAPYFENGTMDFSLRPHQWNKTTGLIINIFSFSFFTACIWAMKSNFEVKAKPKDSAELVTAWPFSIVRNPIYLVALILGIGWSLSFWSLWSSLLTVLLYFVLVVKIFFEEEFLIEKFGDEYKKYKTSVPKLLPKRLW